jgi:hypothetical protein
VGGVCAAAIGGMTAEVIGWTLVTLGLGAIVLLVFYEIGLSEDRELAKEEEQRRRQAQKRTDAKAPRPRRPRRPI